MTPVVCAHDLAVRYGDFIALDGATFDLNVGEALGVVGPNGSGKSTLLKSIAGLLAPSAGDLQVFGLAPNSVPAGSIAYVPQVESVDWSFPATVWDVVAMGRFPRLPFWRRFGAADRAAVERALDAVNVRALAQRPIAELSGGQQQRTFVARALAQEPRLLLLDEPTTGVDAATESALRGVVRALVKTGLPVIMSTHDLDSVAQWFDRLMVLDRRVLAIGTPREVAESGAYASIREHTHTHGHLRFDHEPHETHALHPEIHP
ncbi:MAG TPA: metal ABC transporter ATP-binding protein [Candidatus Tyrphobacter sp.]